MISVHELWLKGDNQSFYRKTLKEHILQTMEKTHNEKVHYQLIDHRHILESKKDFDKSTIDNLLCIPGIHSIQSALKIDWQMEQIFSSSLDILRPEVNNIKDKKNAKKDLSLITFAVRVKRAKKTFPLTSTDLAAQVGHHILKNVDGLKVNLRNPDIVLYIRILQDGSYLYTRSYEGVGGLPVGTSGHLVCLLSGGFDSPVASYLMSKRGCKQTFLFFYAYPYVGEEVKDKIIDLMKVLGRYQNGCNLYIIPFGTVQKDITKQCKTSYRTILFRWFMIKIATRIAQKVGAGGIVTGDSLGQVSSQTLDNISLVNQATALPIFRPLSGFNKQEIINLSEKIGTHPISVRPHDDACSLFAAKHPITKPYQSYWQQVIGNLQLEDRIVDTISQMEIISF